MLTYVIFGFKYIFWWFQNTYRRFRKAPDYVVFFLEGDYPDLPQANINPLLRMLHPPKISLLELAVQIRTVAEDSRVKGVIFRLHDLDLPLARIDALRSLIGELREAGKNVITWASTYDTRMYYLASAANSIVLLPGGVLAPLGLYQSYTFLADALGKIGLKADFIQISPYKSAMDTFTRNEMSTEVREMGNWLADSTMEEILNAIADGRKIDKETAARLLDQTPCTDLKAIEMGAVDHLLGEDDLPELLGVPKVPARLLPWEDAQKRLVHRPLKRPGKYIALMSIEGMIVDGRSSTPPVEPPVPIPVLMDERAGDLSVVSTIRQIMTDKRAAGVIVYVNSRGGSAAASEKIHIGLTKLAAQKPLIIAMGPVAASGGYWVSTPGKIILAQPNTITGSIGVLGGKIADNGLMRRLLVNQESISRGENIRVFEPEAPFTEREFALIWEYIQRIYDLFLERVSAHCEMSKAAVDAIGGGRVWTGRQAFEHGLINDLGGLDLAFAKIRELTGLGERAPIRLFGPGKQWIPPITEPTSLLKYGLESLSIFNGKAMCICPWLDE